MKRARLVTCMAALVLISAWAAFGAQMEPPAVLWETTLLNGASCIEIRETEDGDLVMAGSLHEVVDEFRKSKFYIRRTDSQGNQRWEQTFVASDEVNVGMSLCTGMDGSHVIGGITFHELALLDRFVLLDISNQGALVWNKTFSADDAVCRPGAGVVAAGIDGAGGYVFAGYDCRNTGYVAKIDANGDFLWKSVLKSSAWPSALLRLLSVATTPDGGFAVAGSALVPDLFDWSSYLARLDKDGGVLWERALAADSGALRDDMAPCVRLTHDGGFIMAGTRFSKFDSRGEMAWQTPEWMDAMAVEPTSDGGYIATGVEPGDAGRLWRCGDRGRLSLSKLDEDGNIVWQTLFEGGSGRAAIQIRDGGYVVLGCFEQGEKSGYRLMKLAPDSSPAASFQRGDASGDGSLEISDAIQVLSHLFQGGQRPGCDDAADANDDGKVDITDPIFSLAHIFQGGLPLPGPSGVCGADPTPDDLDCKEYGACE